MEFKLALKSSLFDEKNKRKSQNRKLIADSHFIKEMRLYWSKTKKNAFLCSTNLNYSQCVPLDLAGIYPHCTMQKAGHLLLWRYVNFVIFFTYLRIKTIHEIYIRIKMMILSFRNMFFQKISKILKLKISLDACNWNICFLAIILINTRKIERLISWNRKI